MQKKIFVILSIVVVTWLTMLAASAASISMQPDRINQGDQVTITIQDLADNSTFSLALEGKFYVSPGSDFSFETHNFVMPFVLSQGTLTATMQNTKYNVLSVKMNDTEVRKVGSSVNGYFSTSEAGTIPAGTYEYLKLGGTASDQRGDIISSLVMQGTKMGPDDASISFTMSGIADGTLQARVDVNQVTIFSDTLIIGNPAQPTNTRPPSGGGGGGSGAASFSPTQSVTSSVTAQISPAETYTLNETGTSWAETSTSSIIPATSIQTAALSPESPAPTPTPHNVIMLIGALVVAATIAIKR